MHSDGVDDFMTHELKTWPEYFEAVANGLKRFELRDSSDRDFKVGDKLRLEEWIPATKTYTGRYVTVRVLYVLPLFGTAQVIMSIGGIIDVNAKGAEPHD